MTLLSRCPSKMPLLSIEKMHVHPRRVLDVPQTSFSKYNRWRPLDHPVAYNGLLKQGSI